MADHRIVFIVVYFGSLPFWMPAFLLSCQKNPDVDWLIFTDSSLPDETPSNVTYINMDRASFSQLCTQKIGLNARISPSFSYKLCDYRPAYGVIFEDYLKDYDFWGHCDIDIVWGDIRHYFDQEVLTSYDIATTRLRKITGHCCLFRNVVEINRLCMGIPNLFSMLEDSDTPYAAIDEKHMTYHLRKLVYPSLFIRLLRRCGVNKQSSPRVYWDRHLTTKGCHQRAMVETNGSFWWRDGKTYNAEGNEIMYIHFHKIKQTMHTINFTYNDKVTEFSITQHGFIGRKL